MQRTRHDNSTRSALAENVNTPSVARHAGVDTPPTRASPAETPPWEGEEVLRHLALALRHFRRPIRIAPHPATGERLAFLDDGDFDVNRISSARQSSKHRAALLGYLPGLYPEWLGDRGFCEAHRLRFPYVAGAMANGIATVEMVVEMARAGMLGFFGAAGLPYHKVQVAIDDLHRQLHPQWRNWGANLIHSPHEPHLEEAVAELYIQRQVERVSASAYVSLTPALVRYALRGLHLDPSGHIRRTRHLFAKVSRPEVARRFMSPAPSALVRTLVARGQLTQDEAELARFVPLAEDITVEADSGGHTDNQPLGALLPILLNLRDQLTRQFEYTRPIRIGAAGGLGTPESIAAAFSMGAAYVLTGSVNQSCVESGLSPHGKQLLAQANLGDVMMAPAADMFEMGVQVQVLKRGTLFGPRARTLYAIYRHNDGLDCLDSATRKKLEDEIFRAPLDDVWSQTQDFFQRRDPAQLERAAVDAKYRMALVFRWYLGLSSTWANRGDPSRTMDYQIWCGPAMAAFNAWTQDSFLHQPDQRRVVQVALNLLEGAAYTTRLQQLRSFGIAIPQSFAAFRPRPLALH